MSPEEILSRISISKWLRRFWTLQEAVLAKVLWFQFRDTAYRTMSHAEVDREAREALFDNEVAYHCKDFDFSWHLHANELSYTERVAFVWDALKYRTSSFEDDQPICIATLLDMPSHRIAHLQELDCPARFEELWFLYQSIPTGVLFIPGPKLTQDHLHWAPSRITSLGLLPPPGMSTSAIPTRQGLEVTHHGIMTREALTRNRHGVIAMHLPNDKTYLIRQNTKQDNPPWENLDFTAYHHVAVLLSQPAITDEDEEQPFERALGALVGIKGSGREVLKATYLRAVSVLLQGSRWETEGQREWTAEEEGEKRMRVNAAYTHPQQRWLIS